jgi:hypothetical protein
LGKQKESVFQNKQRSPETGEVNELEIKFEKEVLQTTQDNLDLINALGNLTNSSITVYHKNPYAHVSILDYQDGSSCDVFVTGSNELSIVPSYRGSLNSLIRVAEQISREFEEGKIREATHENVEFSELFI